MNRNIFIAAILTVTLSAYATEDTSGSLRIVADDGTYTTVPADGLQLTFHNGTMTAESSIGILTFDTSRLSHLIFGQSTGIETIGADSAITIWSVDGVLKGEYSSIDEARAILPPGLYIINTITGQTSKIIVK